MTLYDLLILIILQRQASPCEVASIPTYSIQYQLEPRNEDTLLTVLESETLSLAIDNLDETRVSPDHIVDVNKMVLPLQEWRIAYSYQKDGTHWFPLPLAWSPMIYRMEEIELETFDGFTQDWQCQFHHYTRPR